MTSYFARSASFQGIANLPKLLQTKGIKSREAGQPNFRSGSKGKMMPLEHRQSHCEELKTLQERWIELFWTMTRDRTLNQALLAAPFLSVALEDYKRNRDLTILYVGKATGRSWYRAEFEADPCVAERQTRTREFIWDVADRQYRSAFWHFARRLSDITNTQKEPFSNLIWSNLAKIGVTNGNPTGRYLQMQTDLAIETLIAEIECYRPALIVFASSDYAKEAILKPVLRNFGADQNDRLWIIEPQDTRWRPSNNQLPAVMCIRHPQGQLGAILNFWEDRARQLLQP
jgi:hypothetical protein